MDFAAGKELLSSRVSDERIIKHSLASAAVLKALARRLGRDPETWALAGLLHDLDYEQTAQDMARHGLVTPLAALGVWRNLPGTHTAGGA